MGKDLFAVLTAVLIALGLIYGLFAVTGAQEDEPWFNCYLSGDMNAGPACPWHGFVNLGVEDPS